MKEYIKKNNTLLVILLIILIGAFTQWGVSWLFDVMTGREFHMSKTYFNLQELDYSASDITYTVLNITHEAEQNGAEISIFKKDAKAPLLINEYYRISWHGMALLRRNVSLLASVLVTCILTVWLFKFPLWVRLVSTVLCISTDIILFFLSSIVCAYITVFTDNPRLGTTFYFHGWLIWLILAVISMLCVMVLLYNFIIKESSVNFRTYFHLLSSGS